MDDAGTTHPAQESSSAGAAELARLYRLVQGLLDADVLLEEVGGGLLEAIEVARRSYEEGEVEEGEARFGAEGDSAGGRAPGAGIRANWGWRWRRSCGAAGSRKPTGAECSE